MTTGNDIREMLERDPFEAFRIRLTSGDVYDIRDPHSVALMRTRLFVAVSKSDKTVYVPYLHIAALETIADGRRSRSGGRRGNGRR